MNGFKKPKGIFPVLVTPMTEDEEVDEKGMKRLVRYVLKAEASGVLVCGSMGEFPALTSESRKRAIEIVKGEVEDKVLVVAGTSDTSARRILENTVIAQEAGADCALVAPPYYFPLVEKEVIPFYRKLTAETSMPIILYNIPKCTKIPISLEVVRQLGDEERIIGVKDSSADFISFQGLVREAKRLENFAVLMGMDGLILPAFVVGADGATVWASNIVPKLPVELYKAIKDNNLKKARDIQERLISLGEIIGRRAAISGVKTTLSLLGICDKIVSKPLPHFSEEETRELAENLKKLKILQSG